MHALSRHVIELLRKYPGNSMKPGGNGPQDSHEQPATRAVTGLLPWIVIPAGSGSVPRLPPQVIVALPAIFQIADRFSPDRVLEFSVIQGWNEFKLINDAFPHVGRRLSLFWGEPEFNPYMEGLLTGGREGKRLGFPLPVANALLELAERHERKYPGRTIPPKKDNWNPFA
jgi:hypothetical protein